MNGFSIIIPAHNEAESIEATLRSILASKLDRPLQIIVVANACKDDTAERARRVDPSIEVIDTPTGGKPNAMNMGDKIARYFPRAFVDADIQLSEDALQKVADAFKDPNCHIAAPAALHTYSGRNPFLRGYYKLWSSLPYVRDAIMGSGFYAIDSALRARFDQFPAITADDKFIQTLSRPDERRKVAGCSAMIKMPETFDALIKVKTRWTYGNMELAESRPDSKDNDQNQYKGVLGHLVRRPWLWVHVPTFLYVWRTTKIAAKKKLAAKQSAWDRDDTSRKINAA